MILYKYVDLATGKKILASGALSFTKCPHLNDPFETKAGDHPGDSFWGPYTRYHAISTSYPILSLTRNPLNPIMWSHYGVGHTGLVFGIDCNDAGLNDEMTCVLPAKHGNIIYTKSKPTDYYNASESAHIFAGQLSRFDENFIEALSRIFLYKSSEWHYEEEVRVVKSAQTLINADAKFLPNETADECSRFLLPINRSAIRSVHIGYRTYCGNYHDTFKLISLIRKKLPDAAIHTYGLESKSWTLRDDKLGDDWQRVLAEDHGFTTNEQADIRTIITD